MANLGYELDHEQVEEGRNFDPIPAGDYLVQIKDSDVVETKAGGKMAKLTFEVISGPYERRIIFDNVNHVNANPTAQLIGQQRFKAICNAVGWTAPLNDTAVLEFKPMLAKVAIEQDKNGEYPPKNVIKGIKAPDAGQPPGAAAGAAPPRGGGSPAGGAAVASASPPRQPAAAGGAAWRR